VCPSLSLLYLTQGSRAYLLGDMEDFWSITDLTDLSRGALSQLSRWLRIMEAETASFISK